MDYSKKLEQQNELLKEKVKELSYKEDRLELFYDQLVKRRNKMYKKLADCSNITDKDLKTTAKAFSNIYQDEIDFINELIKE